MIGAAVSRVQMHRAGLFQAYLLDQDADPDCEDDLRQFWVLATGTLVRPRVDFRRLSRALEKLTARHDCLRTRLDRVKGQWMAFIAPPYRPEIRQVDLGDVPDDTFDRRLREIANAPMPLINNWLAEMIVVQCGSRGDVIITRVHHAITDGYGMVVLTEDLLKYLIGLPILTRAVSHADYIARFEAPPPEREAEFTAFWTEMHKDFPPAPPIGRKRKGLEPLYRGVGKVEPRQVAVSTRARDGHSPEDRADRANIGTATLMFTGFLESLCQLYGPEELMFVTHVARTNPALDTYAGDHSMGPVTRYRVAGKDSLETAARRLSGTLMEAMAHLPHEAARRGTPWYERIIEAGGYPRQFSAYQPKALTRQDRSIFRDGLNRGYGQEQRVGPYWLSSVDVSIQQRPLSELQFNVGADNGRGGFGLRYDGLGYDDAEIEAMVARICDLLELDPIAMILK